MTGCLLRRICLVGVRGVGKTTLIRQSLTDRTDFEHIVGSNVLRELVGPEFARFDHLPAETKRWYRERAIDWMDARQAVTQKHILCDGHTSLLDESCGRVVPVFTELDCRFFRELILLEAPVAVVLERRRSDSSKRRSLDPMVVAAEIEGERRTSAEIAERYGMKFHRLPWSGDSENPDALRRLLQG